MCDDAPRILYDVRTAARLMSVSRSTLYSLMADHSLASCTIATRRLVAHEDIVDFVHRTKRNAAGGRLPATLTESQRATADLAASA